MLKDVRFACHQLQLVVWGAQGQDFQSGFSRSTLHVKSGPAEAGS
jgi:hypothetical protein